VSQKIGDLAVSFLKLTLPILAMFVLGGCCERDPETGRCVGWEDYPTAPGSGGGSRAFFQKSDCISVTVRIENCSGTRGVFSYTMQNACESSYTVRIASAEGRWTTASFSIDKGETRTGSFTKTDSAPCSGSFFVEAYY